MEQIMDFINQYWGVTLVGGITVGGLISFTVVQVKYLIKDKTKNVTINSLMDTVTDVLNKHDSASVQAAEEKAALLRENEMYKATQAATFKAISYLTMASKLPIEEKLKLQEEFSALKDMAVATATPIVKDAVADAKDAVKEEAPLITNIVTEAINTASSLLDKYTKGD